MKTRYIVIAGCAALIALLAIAATTVTPGLPISQYPNNGFPNSNALFVMARPGVTNENISFGQLAFRTTNSLNAFVQTLASTSYVNTSSLTVSNALVTFVTNTSNSIVGSGFSRLEVQTNGVRVGLVTNLNFASGVTGQLSGTTAILGTSGGAGGELSGSTNFINLSVQAAKLPNANFPTIDASWNDWELVYYQTNDAGSLTTLSSSWQFVVPMDYATNTMKVRLISTLTVTNGPNTSNVIWGVSFFRVGDGGTNDLHNLTFGNEVLVTNQWTASSTATNLVKYVVADCGTNSALSSGDLAIIKISRKGASDTVIAPSALVGLQLEYTRP